MKRGRGGIFLGVTLFLLSASGTAVAQTIETVAGSGPAGVGQGGFGGDGGPATSARLNNPAAVAVDAAGNLFIADHSNNRIRKVDAATGVITTFAGTGSGAFSGDGGPATLAQIFGPTGIAIDATGNIFLADSSNHRIRRVDGATGVIATVAGTGVVACSGDVVPALSAAINPHDVAVDGSGNVFYTENGPTPACHRIRRLDALTGVITTVAGAGPAGFSGDDEAPATSAQIDNPQRLVLDGAGNLFFSDSNNHRIRQVNLATGLMTTIAGSGPAGEFVGGFGGDGGPATSALLNRPQGLAFDPSGNLFIADTNNHRIRKIDFTTGIITTIAGTVTPGFSGDGGPATSAQLFSPSGITFDASGNLYIADFNNQRIRKVTLEAPNIPPVADAGGDQVVECTSPAGADVTLDASASSDPDGDALTYTWAEGPTTLATTTDPVKTATVPLGLGTHTIDLTVDDGNGGTATDTVAVTVHDTTAPSIGALTVNPGVLWPPNHKMVPVTLTPSAADACDPAPACQIISVTSNEPVDGLGDGDTAPDWEITGALTVNLRAERSGNGNGRVYTLAVQCADASGNASAATATVTVPHSQAKK